MIINKEMEKISEIAELIKKAEYLPYMTRRERLDYIKELQKANDEVGKDKNLISLFSKGYPITDKNGNYNGTYFKILIGWATFYNITENLIENRKIEELKSEKYKLDRVKEEIEKYYSEAIDNSKNIRIKKNMEAGLKNLKRFYEYGNAVFELRKLQAEDEQINKVLSKKENSYIFWLLTTEEPNVTVVKTSERVKEELKSVKSEEAKKAIELVEKIRKIFS